MLKVYHLREMHESWLIAFRMSADEVRQHIIDRERHHLHWDLAAEVDTDDLEQAFIMTNSIDDFWTSNPKVMPTGKSFRQTSVGDIVVDCDNVIHFCAPAGWYNCGQIEGFIYDQVE